MAYSESLVAELETQPVWTYAEAVAFAADHGLKHRSVIAKIKSLGLDYIVKPVTTKSGEPIVRKSVYVEAIEAAMGVALPSLAKATKSDLEKMAALLALAGNDVD